MPSNILGGPWMDLDWTLIGPWVDLNENHGLFFKFSKVQIEVGLQLVHFSLELTLKMVIRRKFNPVFAQCWKRENILFNESPLNFRLSPWVVNTMMSLFAHQMPTPRTSWALRPLSLNEWIIINSRLMQQKFGKWTK